MIERRFYYAKQTKNEQREKVRTYKKLNKDYTYNFFIVPSFKCNFDCGFCLLKENDCKECKITRFLARIDQVLFNNKGVKFKVKITGGEPFLFEDIGVIIKHLDSFDNIEYIGIGTNGSIENISIPKIKHRIIIYESRHKPDYRQIINYDNSEIRLSCTMSKGKVDNVYRIKDYIQRTIDQNNYVNFLCFRELNKIDFKLCTLYSDKIYDYIKYYKNNIVRIKDILKQMNKDNDFGFIKKCINPAIQRYYYQHMRTGKIIMFKKTDEKALKRYNKRLKIKGEIDEFVLHPDGLLTASWGRERKII